MAEESNTENAETQNATSGTARTAYRVTRTHEGPMGSLSEGYTVEIEDADPRAQGMLDAGLIEKVDSDAGNARSGRTSSTRRGAAKSETKNEAGDSGDRAAKNG